MYFLYIKGRGYFNGYTINPDWNNITISCGGIDNSGMNIKIHSIPVKSKIKFIRDCSAVKASNTFNTEQDAKDVLEELTGVINGTVRRGCTDSEYVSIYGSEITKRVYVADHSLLEKSIPNMVIVEEECHIILKKTNRLNCKRGVYYKTAIGDKTVCNTCRISLVPDEPYVSIDGCIVCRHCLETYWDHVRAEFEKHPMSEDITMSWQAEMLAREL